MYRLKIAVLELTRRCNLSCLHCGSNCSSKGQSDKEMTFSQWFKVLRDLAGMGVKKVVFSGGEPTLNEDLKTLMDFCSRLGMGYGLVTNGYSISEDLWQAMEKFPPYSIGFSLDGLKPTHNKIRQNKKSWDKAMASISRALSLKLYTAVITTVHKANWQDLDGLAMFISTADINAWQIQLATPIGRMKDYGKSFDPKKDQEIFKKVCQKIMIWRKAYSHVDIQAADCFGWAVSGAIRNGNYQGCSAGIHTLGIDALGNVLPCLSLQMGISCGNVTKQDLQMIWKYSDGFDFNRKFKESDIGSQCCGCRFASLCRGGCAVQSHSYYQCFNNSPFCFEKSLTSNYKGGMP